MKRLFCFSLFLFIAFMMNTPKIVPITITAYNPVASQTDNTPLTTASNKKVAPGMIALSRDLEKDFDLKFGDRIVVSGLGCFVFEDRMHRRWYRRADILMFSEKAARKFGRKKMFLILETT